MVSAKHYGSVKRFGARYGRRLKHKIAEIEQELRKKHACPYCHAKKVKRQAVGIWFCEKCKSKFTGKAYSVAKKITPKEEKEKTEMSAAAEERGEAADSLKEAA